MTQSMQVWDKLVWVKWAKVLDVRLGHQQESYWYQRRQTPGNSTVSKVGRSSSVLNEFYIELYKRSTWQGGPKNMSKVATCNLLVL